MRAGMYFAEFGLGVLSSSKFACGVLNAFGIRRPSLTMSMLAGLRSLLLSLKFPERVSVCALARRAGACGCACEYLGDQTSKPAGGSGHYDVAIGAWQIESSWKASKENTFSWLSIDGLRVIVAWIPKPYNLKP